MNRFMLADGRFVNTEKAILTYDEAEDFDGQNHISRATGSQWNHEQLHCSSKGTWYIVSYSQYQGSLPTARLVTAEEGAAWLALMGHAIPDSLAEAAEAAEA